MEFRNLAVAPEELPRLQQLALTPVAQAYPRYRLLALLLRWLPLALLLWLLPPLGLQPPALQPLLAAALALLPLLLAAPTWLEARRRAYALREHDLVYRSGLLVQRTVVLPFARVQHVETISGPLERRFRLARLMCFTAGGGSAGVALQGLDEDAAERLRQYLLGRVATHAGPPQAHD